MFKSHVITKRNYLNNLNYINFNWQTRKNKPKTNKNRQRVIAALNLIQNLIDLNIKNIKHLYLITIHLSSCLKYMV